MAPAGGRLAPARCEMALARSKMALARGKMALARGEMAPAGGKMALARGKMALARGRLAPARTPGREATGTVALVGRDGQVADLRRTQRDGVRWIGQGCSSLWFRRRIRPAPHPKTGLFSLLICRPAPSLPSPPAPSYCLPAPAPLSSALCALHLFGSAGESDLRRTQGSLRLTTG